MGSREPSGTITLADTLAVFEEAADPGEPFTASEVGEALDCSRRTAYDKLDQLADEGELKSKKTGARGRVWWRPIEGLDRQTDDSATIDESQFDELVEAVTNYAIFALDAEGRVVTWNDGAERLKGYEREEIVGEHFSAFYTESDREAKVPERNLATAVTDGHVEDEGWRVRADGERFWADVTITAITDDEGTVEGYIKVTRDMTDVREYENRLRQEKERFQSLVQEVEDYAIFMLDPEGYVQSWNSGIERIKGYEREEIVDEHFSTFYTADDREAKVPERNLATAAASGRVHDEGWRVRADGEQFWADVTITALRDEEGELRGFAKVTRDMTEQHEYEEQLLAQRDELDELNQINADIRDVAKAIVSATTREEIEDRVCDRIATSGSYAASWIGEYGPGDGFAVRTGAGVTDAHLDALADAPDADAEVPAERHLGVTALRSGAVETLRRDGETTAEDLPGDHELVADFESVAVIPLVYNEFEYGVLAVYSSEPDAFDERKTSVLGELGETISHAIAAIRRREREQALTTLHESTRDLLHAETREQIAEIVVSTATADLDMDGAIVYGFDTTDNLLVPLTVSPHSEALETASRAFQPGDDSDVWSSFVDGEIAFVERADEVFPAARTLGIREALVVPLGDHGVFVVGWRDVETFESDTRKLVELLASTAQAAFHRVESEANLREREDALQAQNSRLQRLNELNSVVREVSQRLVGATSRKEIQEDVCEVLTTVDRFRFAWIGGRDAADDDLTPLAWRGTGQSYLDYFTDGGDGRTENPAASAARSGEITVVSNVADDLRAAPWRKEAFSREFQSVVSIPLTYGEHSYGVLTVYADRPGMFDDREQSVFAELGYSIAHAINTVEMKQALLADRITELEFRLPSDLDALLPRLARLTDSRVEFEGIISTSDGGVRIFFTTREGDPDAVLDQLVGSAAVEGARLITERDDGALFEARVSEDAIAARLVDYNASLRDLTATNETVHATIDVPSSVDVRTFVERFQSEYPGVEFLARRERDRPIETPERFRSRLEDALTDRQLEVLETAYFSGFFDSPRGSTGGDLAEALDVSQPTVTTHLRTAQRKLLDLMLESQ